MFVQICSPNELFVFLLLSFESSLYILYNSPLSAYLLQIFSPLSMAFLLDIAFHGEVSILIKSRLSVISFMDHDFGVVSKNSSPYSRLATFFSYVIF